VVATPQKFNEAGFNQNSYCAWHDFTTPLSIRGDCGMAFVNMPYVAQRRRRMRKGLRQCAPTGDLDGVTIVLGHEIAETLTDPGAESSAGQVSTAPGSTTRVGETATSARGWEMGCRFQVRRST